MHIASDRNTKNLHIDLKHIFCGETEFCLIVQRAKHQSIINLYQHTTERRKLDEEEVAGNVIQPGTHWRTRSEMRTVDIARLSPCTLTVFVCAHAPRFWCTAYLKSPPLFSKARVGEQYFANIRKHK